MTPGVEIQLIAVFVSVACALPGCFLVLRQMSMMADSITHTILLGIVLAFFVTRDLNSPLLIAGAALMGVATVWLTETLSRTRLVSEDSAIGIVFPFLFSIAIILITRYASSIHLDTDAVLMGELAFAPFDRWLLGGRDMGAKALYTTGVLLLLNVGLIALFFKELKLASFDHTLAAVLGFSPALIHYGLMSLVSVTAVGAFEAVGSVLVVVFMVGPPLAAYLLTDALKHMLWISAALGALSAVLGYPLALLLDASIAGSMALSTGLIFAAVFVFSPRRGLIGLLLRKRRQRQAFAELTLLTHLLNHENKPEELEENARASISAHLRWDEKQLGSVIQALQALGCIRNEQGLLKLTAKGRQEQQQAATRLLGERGI